MTTLSQSKFPSGNPGWVGLTAPEKQPNKNGATPRFLHTVIVDRVCGCSILDTQLALRCAAGHITIVCGITNLDIQRRRGLFRITQIYLVIANVQDSSTVADFVCAGTVTDCGLTCWALITCQGGILSNCATRTIIPRAHIHTTCTSRCDVLTATARCFTRRQFSVGGSCCATVGIALGCCARRTCTGLGRRIRICRTDSRSCTRQCLS